MYMEGPGLWTGQAEIARAACIARAYERARLKLPGRALGIGLARALDACTGRQKGPVKA
jgi:hypothetical protein